jgi:hypothetical protein
VAAEFEAIGSRQHYIEEKQGRHFAECVGDDRRSAAEALHGESARPKIVCDEAGDVSVILNHENERSRHAGDTGGKGPLVRIQGEVHFSRGITQEALVTSGIQTLAKL